MKDWLKYARGEGGYTYYRGFALKSSATGVSSKHFCSANYSGSLTPSMIITYNTTSFYDINAAYNSEPLKAWGKLYVNAIPSVIKFTVNTAGIYVFETMNSSYLTEWDFTASDTKLVLYNDSFIQSAQNDNISSSNTFSRIEKTLQTGTYYLTIINQDPTTTAVNCYLIVQKDGELCASGSIYANKTSSFYKIGPSGYDMNCFGYVMGTNTYDASYEKNINNLDSYMSGKGYKNVPSAQNNCIVAYYRSGETTVRHFAKIDSNGTVTSKMDFMELVIHDSYTTYAFMSGGFGNQYRFYVKK